MLPLTLFSTTVHSESARIPIPSFCHAEFPRTVLAIAEIPPDGGTLVAFKRSERSWHGHAPFEGPRRYVMFNWVRSDAALTREIGRHRLSAKLKRLNPFG